VSKSITRQYDGRDGINLDDFIVKMDRLADANDVLLPLTAIQFSLLKNFMDGINKSFRVLDVSNPEHAAEYAKYVERATDKGEEVRSFEAFANGGKVYGTIAFNSAHDKTFVKDSLGKRVVQWVFNSKKSQITRWTRNNVMDQLMANLEAINVQLQAELEASQTADLERLGQKVNA